MFATIAGIPEEAIPIVGIGGGLVVAVIAIVGGFVKDVMRTRAREQSRREIAAYIAERSMSAEEGAKLLEAGTPVWERIKR